MSGKQPVSQIGWGEHFEILADDGLKLAGRYLKGDRDSERVAQEPNPAVACEGNSNPWIVILVHGLGEHSGRYSRVANQMAELGMDVVAYDHRGHGGSPGKRGGLSKPNDLIDDLRATIRLVRTNNPGASICLLGHSMGGIVVARYIDRQIREKAIASVTLSGSLPIKPSALDGHTAEKSASAPLNTETDVDLCILSSPALGLHLNFAQKILLGTLGTFLPKVTIGNGLKPEWLSSDPSIVENYVRDPLVHGKVSGELVQFMLKSISLVQSNASNWSVPTLLVYAKSDRCVNPSGALSFANNAPNQMLEVHEVDTRAHELLSEPDGLALDMLRKWILKMSTRVS